MTIYANAENGITPLSFNKQNENPTLKIIFIMILFHLSLNLLFKDNILLMLL